MFGGQEIWGIIVLKKYKNEFIRIIMEMNLDPSEFSSKEEIMDNNPAFIITYKNSNLMFAARTMKTDHCCPV